MGYEVELRVRKVEERFVEKEERVYGIVEGKRVYVYEWSGEMEILKEFERVCKELGIRKIEMDNEEKGELEREGWKKLMVRYGKEL